MHHTGYYWLLLAESHLIRRLFGMAAGRVLAGQAYGIQTWDPIVLGLAAGALGACATIAGLIPAVRAGSVDPVRALREDN